MQENLVFSGMLLAGHSDRSGKDGKRVRGQGWGTVQSSMAGLISGKIVKQAGSVPGWNICSKAPLAIDFSQATQRDTMEGKGRLGNSESLV